MHSEMPVPLMPSDFLHAGHRRPTTNTNTHTEEDEDDEDDAASTSSSDSEHVEFEADPASHFEIFVGTI